MTAIRDIRRSRASGAHSPAVQRQHRLLEMVCVAGLMLISALVAAGNTLSFVVGAAMPGSTLISRKQSIRPALGLPVAQGRLSKLARRAEVEPSGEDVSLQGKVALVTGCSANGGIGMQIAYKLAKAGATVIGTGISDDEAATISERFTGDLKGEGVNLDVTNTEMIKTITKGITDKYGSIDILINNAGITKDGLFMRMKEPQWDAVLNVNLNSVHRMTSAVISPMMKKRWGRIVQISSVVGALGNPGQTNYAATKAGVIGFTKALAREVASRGITVNSVAPGFINTDMTKDLKDDWKDKLLQQVPLGRLGEAGEVADAVLFLCKMPYVTGQNLHVNGGMFMSF